MFNESVIGNIPHLEIRVMPSIEPRAPHRTSVLHFHSEIELVIVYSGEFCAHIDSTDYVAREGDVLFIGSRVPHETFIEEKCSYAVIQFKESAYLDSVILRLLKYSAKLHGISSKRCEVISSEELFSAVDEVVMESERQNSAYEFFIRSSIYRILGILYRSGVIANAESIYRRREMQKILPALSYVKEHYAEKLTLEEVSLQLGFDPSYFCRLFKKATGATFTEYLNFVRVCKSEKLLYKTKDSILEISEAVGFSSVSYYNRMFKKYLNCTPKYYRSVSYGESVISPEE